MAFRMFEFECGMCDHRFEQLVDSKAQLAQCDNCGSDAKRIISATRFVLDGCSGDYPTAYDAWERKRIEKRKQEIKQTT